MEKYKCLVTLKTGKKRTKTIRKDRINRKIEDNIFAVFGEDNVKRIEVFMWNESTKKHYKSITYDSLFDSYLHKYCQVENKKGYEDFSNYGAWTDGRFQRFYMGKSTGWIPCYLTVWKSNSIGGGAYMESCYKKNSLRLIEK